MFRQQSSSMESVYDELLTENWSLRFEVAEKDAQLVTAKTNIKYLQDSVDFLGEKIRLEAVLAQILNQLADVKADQALLNDVKLDELIKSSSLLLEQMQATQREIKDNYDQVKKLNEIALP